MIEPARSIALLRWCVAKVEAVGMQRRFVFLPYLKTSGAICYRDLLFRNIHDVSRLASEVESDVRMLGGMFFLRENRRIADPTYAVIEAKDEGEWNARVKTVFEFQTLIRYVYSAPHEIFGNTFLTAEHGSVFIFQSEHVPTCLLWQTEGVELVGDEPTPDPASAGDELPGYFALIDNRSPLWVVGGQRIYPPPGHFGLNVSQDLAMALEFLRRGSQHSSLFHFLDSPQRSEELAERVLTALKWYNRSVARDVAEDVALVSLAIAFESLLGLPRGKDVTERFKQAVHLLLGPVPRLESFLEQFYEARSSLVHDGVVEDVMFRATDRTRQSDRTTAQQYRSLSSYARHIFQLCVSTIVHGGYNTAHFGLGRILETNQQRFERLCRLLSDAEIAEGARLERAYDLAQDIERFRFVRESGLRLETMLTCVRLSATDFLVGGSTVPGLERPLRELSKPQSDAPHRAALSHIKAAAEELRIHSGDTPATRSPRFLALNTIIETVWSYTFPQYYALEREAREGSPGLVLAGASKLH